MPAWRRQPDSDTPCASLIGAEAGASETPTAAAKPGTLRLVGKVGAMRDSAGSVPLFSLSVEQVPGTFSSSEEDEDEDDESTTEIVILRLARGPLAAVAASIGSFGSGVGRTGDVESAPTSAAVDLRR